MTDDPVTVECRHCGTPRLASAHCTPCRERAEAEIQRDIERQVEGGTSRLAAVGNQLPDADRAWQFAEMMRSTARTAHARAFNTRMHLQRLQDALRRLCADATESKQARLPGDMTRAYLPAADVLAVLDQFEGDQP